MNDLAYVVALAGGTFLMRTSLVVLLANVALSERLEQALKLVAPAVLAGLVAQTLFIEGGTLRPFGIWYVAAAVAVVVAWRTRSMGWTLFLGMVAVWVLGAVA